MPATAARKIKKSEKELTTKPTIVQRAMAVMQQIRETHGMQSKIAAAIKVKPQAVHQWKMVPPEHCEIVAEITGFPPHVLRPDHFNRPTRARAS